VRSTERSSVEPVGSAAGAAVAAGVVVLEKESVTPLSVAPELDRTMIGGEVLMVGAEDEAEAEVLELELVAPSVEDGGVAEVTGTGARVEAEVTGAEQSVAETVTVLVETTVTVTKPSVPMTTVGVTMPPEDELVVVGVITEVEAEDEAEEETEEKETETVEDVPVVVEERVEVGVAELVGVLRVRI